MSALATRHAPRLVMLGDFFLGLRIVPTGANPRASATLRAFDEELFLVVVDALARIAESTRCGRGWVASRHDRLFADVEGADRSEHALGERGARRL
jgi:hypothetical protein